MVVLVLDVQHEAQGIKWESMPCKNKRNWRRKLEENSVLKEIGETERKITVRKRGSWRAKDVFGNMIWKR